MIDAFTYELIAWSIDFEGSVGIGKRTRENGAISYDSRVEIYNTSRKLLERFRKRVRIGYVDDGQIFESRTADYTWKLTVKEKKTHLPAILPFLYLKQEQAKLVIELHNILKPRLGSRHRWTDIYTSDEQHRLEELYRFAYLLNQKKKPEELTDAEKLLREFRRR